MPTEMMNPCGIFARDETPLAPRRPLGEIRTVGLFSNLKHNADAFLDEIGALLKARFPHLEFVRFQKIASRPAAFTEDFLGRSNAVVAAFGD